MTREISRFLNSVLVQGTYTIAGSPLPETGFFLKGAARIPGFPGLSWSGCLFSISPGSVESGGRRDIEEREGGRGREGKGKSGQGAQKAKDTVEQLEAGWEGARPFPASEAFLSSETVSKIFLFTSCKERNLSGFHLDASNFKSR